MVCSIAYDLFVSPALLSLSSWKFSSWCEGCRAQRIARQPHKYIWPSSEPVLPWHHSNIIDSRHSSLSFLLCWASGGRSYWSFPSFTWLCCWLWAAIPKTTMCLDIVFMQFFPNRIFSRQSGSSLQGSLDLLMENYVELGMGQRHVCLWSWRRLVKDWTALNNHKHFSSYIRSGLA